MKDVSKGGMAKLSRKFSANISEKKINLLILKKYLLAEAWY